MYEATSPVVSKVKLPKLIKPVKPVKAEPSGSMKTTIVDLHKACNIDSDGRDVGAIGYFTSAVRAKSACGDNPYTTVKIEKALQVAKYDESPEEYTYYILKEPAGIKADTNFELFAKQLRDKAMAKLSDAEKEVLGLVKK